MTITEMLKSTEFDWDSLSDSKDFGVIRLDAELNITYLNETAEQFLGIPSDRLLGKKFATVVNLEQLSGLMAKGISFNNQLIMIGDEPCRCDYFPVIENKGVVGGVFAMARSGAKPDLPCNELSDFLNSAHAIMDMDYDGIIVIDRSGTVIMVNQAFAEVLDTTPQAMIGKHVYDAYHNSTRSRLPIVMETGVADIGDVHYMNGRDVITNRYPLIKDGKIIGAVGKILFKDVRDFTLFANKLQNLSEDKPNLRPHAVKHCDFKYDIHSIVGHSKPITELKATLLRVAKRNSNVLLRGESGTGKELFAHAIHAASERRYAPFIKVNCAAIPEHLLESELFGYAEGAFTGSKKGGQVGKFELANGGTIFLDEIGDMSYPMQAKLLRVLQEKELVPLGSNTSKKVDVRIVAATNGNLEHLVKDGKFREDLYYRLNVVALTIPALRERKEDLYFITQYLIDKFNSEFSLDIKGLDTEAWDVIKAYDWPGNIRELRNVIESAFNLVTGPLIRKEHLPSQVLQLYGTLGKKNDLSEQGLHDYISMNLGKKQINEIMEEIEKIVVEKALDLCNGNKLHAAHLLGISRPGLYKKLQKMDIDKEIEN